MGMCLALRSVSNENISKILESPALIWRLIAPDDPEMYLASVSANRKGVFSRLFGKKSSETDQEIPELEFVEGENIEDDLDKSWQGIHNCLNKQIIKPSHPWILLPSEAKPPVMLMLVMAQPGSLTAIL